MAATPPVRAPKSSSERAQHHRAPPAVPTKRRPFVDILSEKVGHGPTRRVSKPDPDEKEKGNLSVAAEDRPRLTTHSSHDSLGALSWERSSVPRTAQTAPSVGPTEPLVLHELAEKVLVSLRIGSTGPGRPMVQLAVRGSEGREATLDLSSCDGRVRVRIHPTSGALDTQQAELEDLLRSRGIDVE